MDLLNYFTASKRFLGFSLSMLTLLRVVGQTNENAKNSLDWPGNYRGMIPCADCEGIETTVSLNKNQDFQIRSIYLGKAIKPRMDKGKFTWNSDGNSITLTDSGGHVYAKYKVQENALIQLDMNGKKISGPLSSMFILTKGFYAIQEKYWKLIELNGKPVRMDSNFRKEPHLFLKENQNLFSGNGGCNNISGQYKLTNPDSVSFSKVISTMMACPDLQLESLFLKALSKVRAYRVSGDKLSFIDENKKTVAVFKSMLMHG
jgi:copper homeostasis protein (lipoprotein)